MSDAPPPYPYVARRFQLAGLVLIFIATNAAIVYAINWLRYGFSMPYPISAASWVALGAYATGLPAFIRASDHIREYEKVVTPDVSYAGAEVVRSGAGPATLLRAGL